MLGGKLSGGVYIVSDSFPESLPDHPFFYKHCFTFYTNVSVMSFLYLAFLSHHICF